MLWYQAWLETRWRALIGLAVLLCTSAFLVMMYPRVARLIAEFPATQLRSEIGGRVQAELALERDFQGYVWSKGFRQDLAQLTTFFAALLGTGGLLPRNSSLFLLSLPVSRRRWIGVRSATGLAELFLLTIASALAIPVLAPLVGNSYATGRALVYGLCLFVGGSVFLGAATLLSAVYRDMWRPLLITLGAAILAALLEQLICGLHWGLFDVMSGGAFFRSAQIPWIGLLAAAGLSLSLLAGATAMLERREF